MQLTIDSVKPTSTGKSLVVKAGGKDYFAKTNSGLMGGMTIEAETKDSQFNGKTNTWIEKWKQVNAAPQAPAVTGSAVGGQPAVAAPNYSAPWLPFASNTVAHAIQAQIITAPNQIEAWTRAAKEAFYKVNGEI